MKVRQKNKKQKFIYISVGAIICVVAGGLLFAMQIQPNTSENPYISIKDVGIHSDPQKSNPKEEAGAVSNQSSDEIPTSQAGSITITSLEQSGGYVHVRVDTMDFAVKQCVYSFKISDGKPVVREQSGGCEPVSIPEGEFDRIGVYTLTVTAYGSNQKISTSQNIDVR